MLFILPHSRFAGCQFEFCEIRVRAAQNDDNSFVFRRLIHSRQQSGKSASATGLNSEPDFSPKEPLCSEDLLIGDQKGPVDIFGSDRETEISETLRAERIGRDTPGLNFDGFAGPECFKKSRAVLRLDSYDLDASCETTPRYR